MSEKKKLPEKLIPANDPFPDPTEEELDARVLHDYKDIIRRSRGERIIAGPSPRTESETNDPTQQQINNEALRQKEQAKAHESTAELVVQSTLAYIGAKRLNYPIHRYIPVDFYLDEWDVAQAIEIRVALHAFFGALGCEYIEYPAVARSSTHGRGVVKTSKKSAKEFAKYENSLVALFENKEFVEKSVSGKSADASEDYRAYLEFMKLRADIDKAEAEKRKIESETLGNSEKHAAETAKLKAERWNIFATAFSRITLTIIAGATITIGGISLSQSEDAAPKDDNNKDQIVTHIVPKSKHASDLEEFLKKVGEIAETVLKAEE